MHVKPTILPYSFRTDDSACVFYNNILLCGERKRGKRKKKNGHRPAYHVHVYYYTYITIILCAFDRTNGSDIYVNIGTYGAETAS